MNNDKAAPTPSVDDTEVGLFRSDVTEHVATLTPEGWVSSWIPGRILPEDRARDSVRVAALLTLPEGNPLRSLIPALARDLGMPVKEVMAAAYAPTPAALAVEPIPVAAPRPGPLTTPIDTPVARGSSGQDLAAVMIDAHAATNEAYDIPDDLPQAVYKRLFAARRRAVLLLISLDRPGLTAEGLAHDVARLRQEITATYEEIVVTDQMKRAERAKKTAERKALATEPSTAPAADEPAAVAEPSEDEPLAVVHPLPRRPADASPVMFQRELVQLIADRRRSTVIDLLGRLSNPRTVSAEGAAA